MTKGKIFRALLVTLGLIGLAKGSMQVGKHRHLNNPHGRIIGVMMLLGGLFGGVMMVAGVVAATVYGLLNLSTSDRVQRY